MRKKARKRVILAAGVAVVAGVGALALFPRERPLKVLAARAEKLPELKAVVNAPGEIQTEDSVDIQTEIAGVIVELRVREGDRVAKEQILLKIDPLQTESDVEAAKSSVSALEAEAAGHAFQIASAEANAARDEFLKKAAEVSLRQAQVNLTRAQEAYNREQKLLAANLISPDQFEVTAAQFKVNEAEVEAANSRIQQLDSQIKAAMANIDYTKALRDAVVQRVEGARSNLRRADDLLKKTTIRSPLDGVVVKLNVEEGERAVPGVLSSPQATLMTIADLSIIEAELQVDETDIVSVKMGDKGEVLVDALPDATLLGHVMEIGNSPISSGVSSSSQEGKDFKVVLRIDDPPSTLRPGMSCEADITTSVRNDVLVVPIQALTVRDVEVDSEGKYMPPRPTEPVGGAQAAAAAVPRDKRKELQGVFLVGADGLARFRPIKTGIMGEMDVEVLEGLGLGDEVVVGPLKALRTLEEGTRIEVDRTKPFRRLSHRRGKIEEESEEEAK